MATEYQNEIPNFPTAVVNYELANTIKVDDYAGFRLFPGDDWVPLPDFADGTSMNGCEHMFWVLRWRSNNEKIIIATASGYIDGTGQSVFDDQKVEGGAGYIQNYACEAPFFKISKELYKEQNALVDINYELQIWDYKPGI